MDCNRAFSFRCFLLLAMAALVTAEASAVLAQPARRMVYNPTTQKMEPEIRSRRLATWSLAEQAERDKKNAAKRRAERESREVESPDDAVVDFEVEQATYEVEQAAHYYDASAPSCGCDTCIGCGDIACGDCVGGCYTPMSRTIYLGFEGVFVKPRFEDNVAFTTMTSNGSTTEAFADTQFNYDLEFNPRVYLGWQATDGLGMRVTWWQFDHDPARQSASPPANGFGEIIPPPFGDVDISSSIPTNVFSADSTLRVYALDFEAVHATTFHCWDLDVGYGLRYASSEQNYLGEMRSSNNTLRGQINYAHGVEGIGPTISLSAYRHWSQCLTFFGKARGSLLFGDGTSTLTAGEDLDLANPFITTSTSERDDLLPIGEVQLGAKFHTARHRGGLIFPFVTFAMEGQIWNGAGNASSEDGDLGFFGFTIGFGADW